MSVYNPNIPQANDDPTDSQADLLGNFGKLNTDWQVNHVPLTSGANNGFHTLIKFPNVVSTPGVSGLQSALYPQLGSSGFPELFFINALKAVQLTSLPVTTSGTDNGITTPWGLIFNAGSVASGTTTVTFAIPFASALYTLEMTPQGSTATSYTITSLITTGSAITGFNFSTINPSNFYYIAIGV